MEPATGVKMEEVFHLADSVNRISVSQTMAVAAEAEKLKARGVDVADFGPGEPDFPTPEPAKIPMRCPRPHGVKVSIALIPVRKVSWMRCRFNGCGGGA